MDHTVLEKRRIKGIGVRNVYCTATGREFIVSAEGTKYAIDHDTPFLQVPGGPGAAWVKIIVCGNCMQEIADFWDLPCEICGAE